MRAVFNREIRAYFKTPIGYIFIGIFLALSGVFFNLVNLSAQSASLAGMFGNMVVVFLFIVPILTMRLLSEERNLKTDQVLLTAPISVSDIVLGKFFAAICVFLLALAGTFLYILVIAMHGKPAYPEIFCNYLGFFLMGASFISIGIFISSLTENQAVAAVSSFGALLLLYILDWFKNSFQNPLVITVVEWFSVMDRYFDFQMGILNIAPIVYYLSFMSVFLFLTVRTIERRRWN